MSIDQVPINVTALPYRIGQGDDIHRIEPGRPMVLAGVTVSTDLGPIAHSDGDVVIHAVVDALIGAMGWGDIGEHFSDTDPRWKDVPSRVFLEPVLTQIKLARYTLQNVDLTIQAERPRLKTFKPAMVKSLADLLKIPADCVSIKAGTNEQCDAVGRGEAIVAHAVVLLRSDSH